jgi:hypothetical protein
MIVRPVCVEENQLAVLMHQSLPVIQGHMIGQRNRVSGDN